jgi:ABC-type multidrug transport system fused ATPase/permease subunit
MMGSLFMPEKVKSAPEPSSEAAVVRRLLGYLHGDTATILGVAVALLVAASASALAPALIGRAIDQFISAGDRSGLAQTMLLLFGVYILGYLGFMGQIRSIGKLSQQLLKRLRLDIFAHVQRLSMSFFDKAGTGDVMSRLVNDSEVIGNLFSQSLVQALGSMFNLAAIVVAMFALNWQLALVTLVVVPIMFVATRFFSARARVAQRLTRETLGHLSEHLEEDLTSVREVQAFRREDQNIQHFEGDSAAYRDASVQAASITAVFAPTMDVLSTVATALVAGVGGWLAFNDVVTVGVVVAFLAYTDRFFRPVQQISTFYTQMQAAFAASERVFELLDTPPTVVDRQDAKTLPSVEGYVRFDDVYFGYDEDELILTGLSLEAKSGETVALVGATGAGKSTIINLISRFYDVNSGVVSIDGYDVRDVTVRSLRQQLGEVPQNSFLFANTVADNIRYGLPEVPLAGVIEAAKAARAHEFIEALPNGYDTELGERGVTLSQGQRQLLCIARAILANPRLLILDEATSNIDTRTERLVQQAIDALLKGRTAFVIAHRLSTIRNADQIMVIERGQVAERGTHAELLAFDGMYAALYQKQAQTLNPSLVGK